MIDTLKIIITSKQLLLHIFIILFINLVETHTIINSQTLLKEMQGKS